jgi:predicted Na+-dependent transporter
VDRWARAFSIGFLTVIVIGATTRDPTALVMYWNTLLPFFVLLNWSAMAAGYGTSMLAGLPVKQALTVMLETAFQNVPLAISITVLILNTEEAAFIPPIYGVAMMVNGSLFLGYRMWRERKNG